MKRRRAPLHTISLERRAHFGVQHDVDAGGPARVDRALDRSTEVFGLFDELAVAAKCVVERMAQSLHLLLAANEAREMPGPHGFESALERAFYDRAPRKRDGRTP